MLTQPCLTSQVCSPTQFCLAAGCFPRTLLPLAAHELLSGLLLFVLAAAGTATGLTTTAITGPVLMLLNGFGVKQTLPMLQLLVAAVAGAGGTQWRVGSHKEDLQRWVPMLVGTYWGVRLSSALPDAALLLLVVVGMAFGGFELHKRAQLTDFRDQNLRNSLTTRPTKVRKAYSRLHFLPLKRLFLPFLMFSVTILTIFLLGGPAIPSFVAIQPCSSSFWTVTAVYTAFGVVLTLFGQYDDDQASSVSRSGCFGAILTGFGSGIAGLTSEIYLSPALFTVSAQTEPSPLTLLVCALPAFLYYAVQGSVAYSFAIWHAVWALCGAWAGLLLREKLRKSACLRLLALLHAVAAGLMPVYTVLLVLQLLRTGISPVSLLSLC